MACREGEIRLVGREARKSAELQRRLIRFAIEIWVAAACRKAIKGRVACHGVSNFFEATPPSPLCRKRVLFEMRIPGLGGQIFGFGRWRRLASNFYGAVIADFSKIGLVEHKMCLIKASVPVATHFLVCVMNGTSFFNRMLPRTRIALFGANVSFELDWAFRKLVRLLGLRTGRFRGRLSCCVRPWPFCDGMFSRVGLWPFCVLHVFPCWTPSFFGSVRLSV